MNEGNVVKLDSEININKNDIPYPLLYGLSRMEILGNSKVHFDGSYKIAEYSEETLKIKKGKFSVTFSGSALSICNVEKGSFVLTGKIKNISFE